MQVILDVAEFGNDTEAVVHHLMSGEYAVQLHDRHLLTNEELDLMEEILGDRCKSLVQSRPSTLADALKKRAVGGKVRTKTVM